MNVFKKIISAIFNPLANLFGIDSHIDSKSIDKKQIIVGILTLVLVVSLMLVCYMFIF